MSSPPGEHTGPAYPQKPLQELPGAVDVDAGDVAIPPEHAVHGGRDLLPVRLGLGVELLLVLDHLARHALSSTSLLRHQTQRQRLLRRKGKWVRQSGFGPQSPGTAAAGHAILSDAKGHPQPPPTPTPRRAVPPDSCIRVVSQSHLHVRAGDPASRLLHPSSPDRTPDRAASDPRVDRILTYT